MQMAQVMYANENRGNLVQAGLSHGSHEMDLEVAWITTLQRYYDTPLLLRCPGDNSPHWKEAGDGVPIPGTGGTGYRRTTYGINNFLDLETCPWGGPYAKITQVRGSSQVIQFLEMAETGEFAGADHPHVENWVGNAPVQASRHLAIGIHGGRRQTGEAKANFGFLDGHAETLPFAGVFTSFERNNFDPAIQR
jgi:prepilin-type processing-associated H-X9-DG protein